MTPRLPFAAAALAAALATPVTPASAITAQPGVWWGADGYVGEQYASFSGVVVWGDRSLSTSWCAGGGGGSRGEITCTGYSVSFTLQCHATIMWGVSMTLVCADSAGNHYAEVAAATVANKGPFTGTVTYRRL